MKSTKKTNLKRIFIDTSGWIELGLTRERYHYQVAAYFKAEVKRGSKFISCDYVLDEAFTRLVTHQGIADARELKNRIQESEKARQLIVLWTDEVLFEKSWKAFIKYAEHQLSFTDSLIAMLVRDLKIDEILTLDRGFRKIGLTIKPIID